MKYKTLFRLLMKAGGVLFVVQGIGYLAMQLGFYLPMLLGPSGTGTMTWWSLVGLCTPIAYAGAGLYLFFGGEWIVNKAIPSNRPYCHECAYDLTAATENRCPECGTPFRNEDVQPSIGIEIKE